MCINDLSDRLSEIDDNKCINVSVSTCADDPDISEDNREILRKNWIKYLIVIVRMIQVLTDNNNKEIYFGYEVYTLCLSNLYM